MIMSHMIADTEEELDTMALLLGLKISWKQYWKTSKTPHYDISQSKRKEAIKLGAKEITTIELLKIIKEVNCQSMILNA